MLKGETRIPPVDVEALPVLVLCHRDAGRKVGTWGARDLLHIDPNHLLHSRRRLDASAAPRSGAADRRAPTAQGTLTSAPGFRRRIDGMNEEAKLRRVAREFPSEPPAAEWLKLQSYTAAALIEQGVVTSPRLVDRLCGLSSCSCPSCPAQSRARLPAGEVASQAIMR